MDNEFYRTKRLPPYVFAEVNKLKAAGRAAGQDIVDFGMGNPDMPPPKHVIEKLTETLADPRVHRYSRKASPISPRRSLARATSFSPPIPAIRSMPSVSSLRVPQSARSRSARVPTS